MSLDT